MQPLQLGSQSPGGCLALSHLLLQPPDPVCLCFATTHTFKASALQVQALLLARTRHLRVSYNGLQVSFYLDSEPRAEGQVELRAATIIEHLFLDKPDNLDMAETIPGVP